jgi:hypothetical protein
VSPELSAQELSALEAAVWQALRDGRAGTLDILGYGEISTVVRWSAAGRPVAAKRLPPFANEAAFLAYRDCVHRYLTQLTGAGVVPLATVVQGAEGPNGTWCAYCVQPMADASSLLIARMSSGSLEEAAHWLDQVIACLLSAVGPTLGIDGQASNWVVVDDTLRYLDVSTPLLRDEQGQEQLDTELFLASLPWALRGIVRWRYLGAILDKYYEPRGVVVDLLANLYKEGLGDLVPPLVDRLRANAPFEQPIAVAELRRYYRSDASMWSLLQRLRRADRFWQGRVRRRIYPFLLPAKIDRHV